jgi:VanZ family protein
VAGLYRKVAWGLPAFIMAWLIFYVSSLEKIELPLALISFNDLLFHGAAYFIFGITLMVAAYPWNTYLGYPLRTYGILAVIGILYGLSDEIHQSFVPNRTCTVSDFLADSTGVILALAAARMWIKKTKIYRA